VAAGAGLERKGGLGQHQAVAGQGASGLQPLLGRASCVAGILGESDQWASVNNLDPERFRRIADLERQFVTSIKKGQSVEEMVTRAREFVSDKLEELALRLNSGCLT
jgi:hypothetical protein